MSLLIGIVGVFVVAAVLAWALARAPAIGDDNQRAQLVAEPLRKINTNVDDRRVGSEDRRAETRP